MPEVSLRPATRQDGPFLHQLLKATMQVYVAQTWGWDEDWQRTTFWTRLDPAHSQIIVRDGQDVGVLAVEEHADEVFLSQIYILPAHQGQGIANSGSPDGAHPLCPAARHTPPPAGAFARAEGQPCPPAVRAAGVRGHG